MKDKPLSNTDQFIEQRNSLCEQQRLLENKIDYCTRNLLSERQKLLNEKFVWTEEAIERIRQLNQKIFDEEKLLYKEYEARKKELKERESGNDPFLTDYNLNMEINLSIYTFDDYVDGEWGEPTTGSIYDILNEQLRKESRTIARMNYIDHDLLNWNVMIGKAGKHFENDFIHYAFHGMYDHASLAWEDILKVNCIWSEVNVDYQRIIDLFEAKTNQQ